jgi:hypothetical protein
MERSRHGQQEQGGDGKEQAHAARYHHCSMVLIEWTAGKAQIFCAADAAFWCKTPQKPYNRSKRGTWNQRKEPVALPMSRLTRWSLGTGTGVDSPTPRP